MAGAERYIIFNEDDDVLHNIRVELPKPPPHKSIDNYGLPLKEQYFKRVKYPRRLRNLERESESIGEIWQRLDKYRDLYEEEIKFIEREWDRRINGYWFFNNGVPTYIDGWHYFYLNYWKLDVGYPDYRSRDRKFFIFARYTYTTKDAYYPYRAVDKKTGKVLEYFNTKKKLTQFLKDKNSELVKAEEGDFLLKMNGRTCLGFNYPKHRREGATYKADCILFCVTTCGYNRHGGIQSMDGTSAGKAFSKAFVKPWKKLPFFFSPMFVGSTNPIKKLEFDLPPVRISGKGGVTNISTGLESVVDWAESAGRGWYDGDKLHFLHNDECGKTILEDVKERHDVQAKCLTQGNGVIIHGLEINTSTVGEMEEKGGAAFYRLCKLSNYEERNSIGQTQSGLFNLFIPAYDGLEGFIDRFGNSVIEDPDEEDVWMWENPKRDSSGHLIGAKRFLEEKLDDILLRDDEASLKEYEEQVRLHPMSFSQCFITRGSGSGLDIKKILRRRQELLFDKSITKRGNFQWMGGIRDTEVVWVNDSDGRFVISLELDKALSNKKIRKEVVDRDGAIKEVWAPLWPWKFTASADPYKFRKTVGRRLSKGAGAVFYERDKTIDPDGKPLPWSTYRFVCTYSYRPFNPDDYAEDMLMMCVYYGAMMFPEVNIPLIWDHFIRRGYDGFLKYSKNPDGKWKSIPGFYNRGAIPQKIFQLIQNYTDVFIQNERHLEILEEYRKIKGIEDITNRDLFTAVGGAFIGSETSYEDFGGEEEEGFDVSDYF